MVLTIASSSPRALWYLTRGTGAVSLVLLSASVVLGILGPLRFTRPTWPRFSIDTLHRDISLLVVAVLLIHIVTSVLDSFAPIGVLDAVIPLHSAYRPLWTGLGALSFDLILALVITSLLRRRLGYGPWRAIHWLAYVSWPVAVLHGIGTGSDAKLTWMLLLTAVCVLAVLAAVLVRIQRAAAEESALRGTATGAALLSVLGIALFTLLGPLQRGWARRAGTPASLLGSPVRVARVSSPRRTAPPQTTTTTSNSSAAPKTTFEAHLDGTVTQENVSGGAIVNLAMRVSGAAHGRLRIRLGGVPDGGGGLSMTGSQVDFMQDGVPVVMQGHVVQLEGESLIARVHGGAGAAIDLQANLNIDQASGRVTGEVSARPAGSG